MIDTQQDMYRSKMYLPIDEVHEDVPALNTLVELYEELGVQREWGRLSEHVLKGTHMKHSDSFECMVNDGPCPFIVT